jgi:hypothetical protein
MHALASLPVGPCHAVPCKQAHEHAPHPSPKSAQVIAVWGDQGQTINASNTMAHILDHNPDYLVNTADWTCAYHSLPSCCHWLASTNGLHAYPAPVLHMYPSRPAKLQNMWNLWLLLEPVLLYRPG